MATYTIILDRETRKATGKDSYKITKEGADIIWKAYTGLFGKHGQTMERREERGGVCHLGEIDYFKKEGALAEDFDWKQYEVI